MVQRECPPKPIHVGLNRNIISGHVVGGSEFESRCEPVIEPALGGHGLQFIRPAIVKPVVREARAFRLIFLE